MEVPTVERPAEATAGAFRRWLAGLLPLDGDAVDLGTGTGRVALDVAPFATHVVGVDVDRSSLEAARWDAQRRGITNARFEEADVETSDLKALNGGQAFTLATSRLFMSREVVPRVADALARGGHFLVEALDVRNWNEAGGSRFNLAADEVCALLEHKGFAIEQACIEETVHRFSGPGAAEQLLKDRRMWTKWRADGRWETLRAATRRGGTLTESHFIILARRT